MNPLTLLSFAALLPPAPVSDTRPLHGLWACARAHHPGLLLLDYLPPSGRSTWRSDDAVSAVEVRFDHGGLNIQPMERGYGPLRVSARLGEVQLVGTWHGPGGDDPVRCRPDDQPPASAPRVVNDATYAVLWELPSVCLPTDQRCILFWLARWTV